VTTLEYGAKALVEFQDAEAAKGAGIEALQDMFPDAVVAEYATFREERRQRLSYTGGNGSAKKKRMMSDTPGNGSGNGNEP